jgi:hypothetical protein
MYAPEKIHNTHKKILGMVFLDVLELVDASHHYVRDTLLRLSSPLRTAKLTAVLLRPFAFVILK